MTTSTDLTPSSDLTPKQRLFVTAYLANGFNATKAAKEAGYSEKTAYSIGAENLTKPVIAAAIKKGLSDHAMGAEEVLARLADHARGDMGDFLAIRAGNAFFDLEKAEKVGKLHLIKRYAFSRKTGMELELHDPQSALNTLARHHGLLKDRVQHEGEGLELLRQFLSGDAVKEEDRTDGN